MSSGARPASGTRIRSKSSSPDAPLPARSRSDSTSGSSSSRPGPRASWPSAPITGALTRLPTRPGRRNVPRCRCHRPSAAGGGARAGRTAVRVPDERVTPRCGRLGAAATSSPRLSPGTTPGASLCAGDSGIDQELPSPDRAYAHLAGWPPHSLTLRPRRPPIQAPRRRLARSARVGCLASRRLPGQPCRLGVVCANGRAILALSPERRRLSWNGLGGRPMA